MTTTAFASLLAVAAIGPAAAQGVTKYRYWQDLSVSGPYSGKIVVTIAYEDTNGNRKFTPRFAAAYHMQVKTSCDPSADDFLEMSGNAYSKYSFFKGPLTSGRFTHRFENQFEQPQLAPIKGDLNGAVLKRKERGGRVIRTARVNGAFDVEDWDASPALQNCVSFGSYSATPCERKRPTRNRPPQSKVPACSLDPW